MRLPVLRLRTSVVLLLAGTVVATLAVVGSGILAFMIGRIDQQSRVRVVDAAADVAARFELLLANLQVRVELAGASSRAAPPAALPSILNATLGQLLSAVYVIGPTGRVTAASIRGVDEQRSREVVGIDLSGYPDFRAALDRGEALWSDKHLSVVTGTVTLGLAVPLPEGSVIVAELPLEALPSTSRFALDGGNIDYWVIDGRGEIIADTDTAGRERRNLHNQPAVAAGFAGNQTAQTASFNGTDYIVAATHSRRLGWLFMSRIPAGLENPAVRQIAAIVVIAFLGSTAVGLLLAPIWAQGIVGPLRAVALRAGQIARGERPLEWPRTAIHELNGLSADLGTMAAAIAGREEALRRLNEELEDRVARRTQELDRSNRELTQALTVVQQAKSELIRSEKLAALGRLVSGMAHEMNTPIGNGRMAVTTLGERLARFEEGLAAGLRRSELESFIEAVRTGTRIADGNLKRAGELIGSFKRVAADRAGARRRRFRIREVVDEVLLTLSPSLGRQIEIRTEIPEDLLLESYPGELGQVVTNLVENAARHAFAGDSAGTLAIEAGPGEAGTVSILVRDDGIGMPAAVAASAFDPFFTTALGQGGTGLGLFIVHNAVTNILGGTIRLETAEGVGSTFHLSLPVVAPASATGPA